MGTSVSSVVLGNSIANAIKENNEKQGSLKNRVKYGLKHSINFQKAMLKDTFTTAAGVAASVGTAAAVAKSKTAQKLIMKGITNGIDVVKKSNFFKDAVATLKPLVKKATPYLTKAATWVSGLPTASKVVLGAGVLLTGIASNAIRNKYLIDSGKIMKEQEVSAKLEKLQGDKTKEILA